jgi:hypothetical protein
MVPVEQNMRLTGKEIQLDLNKQHGNTTATDFLYTAVEDQEYFVGSSHAHDAAYTCITGCFMGFFDIN